MPELISELWLQNNQKTKLQRVKGSSCATCDTQIFHPLKGEEEKEEVIGIGKKRVAEM